MTPTVQEKETISKEIRTAARHTVVYSLGSVLAKTVSVLMLPFYTHYMTPANYGLLEILELSMSLLGMFLHMGISPALLRSYAISETIEDKKRTVSTAFLFVTVSGLLAFCIGLPFVRPVSALLFGSDTPPLYVLLSFGSLILGYLASMPRSYLRALEASGTVTALDTGSLVVMLSLNVYFIAFLHLGLLGILLSSVIVNGAQAVGLSAWLLRAVGIRFQGRMLREMATFGLPLILSNVAIFTLNFADRFFLQHLRSLDVVGVYAVGYKFGFMINYLLVQPFFVMWQARMFKIHAQPEHPKIFGQIFVLYSIALLYAALAVSVLAPEIIYVLADPRFAGGEVVVPIVALSYVFYGVGYYLQVGLFLASKTRVIGIVSACAAVLNLVLNYVLVLHWGMLGAAWATLLSFVVIAWASYWFSQRAIRLPFAVGRVGCALLLACVLYWICPRADARFASVGGAIRVAVIVSYPFLLSVLGILQPSEIETLTSAKRWVLSRFSRPQVSVLEVGR